MHTWSKYWRCFKFFSFKKKLQSAEHIRTIFLNTELRDSYFQRQAQATVPCRAFFLIIFLFFTVVLLETQVHLKLLQQVTSTDFKYYIQTLVTFSTAEENPGSTQPIILHWKTNAESWSNTLIYLKQTSQQKQNETKRKTPWHQLKQKKKSQLGLL